MLALMKVKPGKGNMELRDIPVPVPRADEVLVKVEKAGICGSDIHLYDGDSHVNINLPVVGGHEFSGSVAEIGNKVEGLKLEDRVVGEPSAVVCGKCIYCRSGNYNLCSERMILGFGRNGAFCEYVTLPANRIHKIPASLSWEEAAITEPLACCVHAVTDNLDCRLGNTVVITGPGTIGLMMLQLIKITGARTIVLGTSSDMLRLEKALSLGADYTCNIDKTPPQEFVRDLTGGYGADIVVECSGAGAAARLCLDLVRKRGYYLQMGLFGKSIEIDFEKILFKELTVTGSFAQKWEAWIKTIQLLREKRVDLKSLVSHVHKLSDWDKGFYQFKTKTGYKILLSP